MEIEHYHFLAGKEDHNNNDSLTYLVKKICQESRHYVYTINYGGKIYIADAGHLDFLYVELFDTELRVFLKAKHYYDDAKYEAISLSSPTSIEDLTKLIDKHVSERYCDSSPLA